MICNNCDELIITTGNPNIHPYMCKQVERKILAPWKEQAWCPKIVGRKNRTRPRAKQERTQTIEQEKTFIRSLPLTKIAGYIKGTKQRRQRDTTFNIEQAIQFAQNRLKGERG